MQPDLTTQTGFDFTLPLRDSTVGLWRFRSSLTDDSDNGNDLASATLAGKFEIGHTENGLTAAAFDGSDLATLAAASAGDFDMASDSFSVEVICRTSSSAGMFLVGKNDGGTPLRGFFLGLGTGVLAAKIGDGVNEAQGNSAATVHDGRWHHIAIVVDRANDLMRMYIDGVEDSGSPWDISSVTGSISAASNDLQVGSLFDGDIDEVCISKEVLTAAAVDERATGRPLLEHDFEENLMLKFLPRIHHGNDDLKQFLKPFDASYAALRRTTEVLPSLVTFDRCPPEHLSHLAANFGFELIDEPFCTTAERREFLRWVIWLYRRKGTVATVEKIIELLGFEATLTEEFPDKTPFVLNFHRLFDPDQVSEVSFSEDFAGNLSQWDPPLNPTLPWRLQNEALYCSVGSGADYDSAILFESSESSFYLEADIKMISAVGSIFGFYLAYQDQNNWLRLGKEPAGAGSAQWVLRWSDGGATGSAGLGLPWYPFWLDYSDGDTIKLWVHADLDKKTYTAGVDDTTLVFAATPSHPHITGTKKGLWLAYNAELEWDNVTLKVLRSELAPVLHTGELPKRVLWIELLNSPPYAAERRQYLERVLPRYLPFGVVLGWVRRLASATAIAKAGGVTFKVGYFLSGPRAASAKAQVGGLTFVMSSLTFDLSGSKAATAKASARMAPMVFTLGPATARAMAGGISYTSNVELIDAGFDHTDTTPTENYATIFTTDADVLINGVRDDEGFVDSSPSGANAGAVECPSACAAKIIYIYDFCFTSGQRSGLYSGSNNKLEVYYSTGGDWTLLEQFASITRSNNKIRITITTPTTAKYFKVRAYDGSLRSPNGTFIGWSEIELMEIKESN